ncbi:MAG TPA: hypothetical protein VL181_03370 [Holophagaceae bacterium]|nr:hypothetical protein [Holophagaceae bacterium]
MPVIGRAGNHPLTEQLAEDPFGALHRGVELRDGRFHRHLLVRTFSEELRQAGLGARLASHPALAGPNPPKAYERYRVEDGGAPYSSLPYLGGRSLAVILDHVRAGALAMPMDSGLALIWSLSQEVAKLRSQGLPGGLVNPHTVWVGFDGQLLLLDAPMAGVLHGLMPQAPALRAALQAYEPPAGLDGHARDLWQLGALAYELLTRRPLPLAEGARREAVERAAEGEDGREPLPAELKRMLHRMLGTEGGFTSIQAFDRDMERALFDGEHVPTTFGLAFYMHDLFLKETRAEATALQAEKEADFFAHTEAARHLQGRIQTNLALLAEAPLARPRRRPGPAMAVAASLLAACGAFFVFRSRSEAQVEALKSQVAASERRAAELSVQQSDLDAKQAEEARLRTQAEAQLAEGRTAEAQAELQRQIEEARARQAALDRQQAGLAAEQKRLAEARLAYERKAAAPAPPPPIAAAPAPALTDAPPRLLAPVTCGAPAGFKGDPAPMKVRVFISEQGRPQKALVMGGDPALADLAKQAAMAGAYAPATHDGAPSRDWVTVTIPFVR